MEKEVLGSKSPLFGRRTMQIRLTGFDYLDAAKMLEGVSWEDQVECWMAKDYLLSSYKDRYYVYFSKSGYTRQALLSARHNPRLCLLDLSDLYAVRNCSIEANLGLPTCRICCIITLVMKKEMVLCYRFCIKNIQIES